MSTPQHPLDLGADLCCDSAHKTLGVLTGGAYLHIAKSAPPMLSDVANRAMALFASTSPSYLILQSLDAMNTTIDSNYVNLIMSTAMRVEMLRNALTGDGWTTIGNESLKLTLATKSRGYTGAEVAALLAQQNIFVEFADPDYIVFMFTAQTADAAYDTLLAALRSLPPRQAIRSAPPILCRPERVLTPRSAMLAPAETLPIDKALGRILAAPGVSCPPAVPILVCGERIDEAAIRAFQYYGVERLDVVL